MNEAKGGSSKRRKALSATLAVIMAFVMLLSGTLAYFYQAKATNRLTGGEKSAVAHDDLYKIDATHWNKDVYVENTGTTDIYVRVKLQERFTKDGQPVTTDTITHMPATAAEGEPAISDFGVGSAAKDGKANADDIHQYFTWTMGGEGKTYLSAKSAQYTKNTAASTGAGTTASPKLEIAAGVAYDRTSNTYNVSDNPTEGTKEYLETPADCDVISMATYLKKSLTEKEEYVGWVADTNKESDRGGWFYWSQRVERGQATGLLLNAIEMNGLTDYQYDIDVLYEVVDDTDMGLWTTSSQTVDENQKKVGNHEASYEAMRLLAVAQGELDESGDQNPIYRCMQKIEQAEAEGKPAAINAYTTAIDFYAKMGLQSVDGKKNEEVGDSLRSSDVDSNAVLISADLLKKPAGMDDHLAKALIALYGDSTAYNEADDPDSLSVGEAAAITKIVIWKNESTECANIASLKGITSKDFPNLYYLEVSGADTITDCDLGVISETDGVKTYDTELLKKITTLSLHSCRGLETVDVSRFSNLHVLQLWGSDNLTSISSTLPSTLRYFGTTAKCDLPDISSAKENLVFCGIQSITKSQATAVIQQINANKFPKLRELVLYSSSAWTEDLNAAEKQLNLQNCPELVGLNINYLPISELTLSDTAFKQFRGVLFDEFDKSVKGTYLTVRNSALKTVDISTYEWDGYNLKGEAISLAGCNQLTGVTRRADQAAFVKYPSTTTVWERVKKADNSYEYYKWVNGVKADGTFNASEAGDVFGD